MLTRMWINQPSTLQPDHQYHGRNVLVPDQPGRDVNRPGTQWPTGRILRVWFTEGPVIDTEVFQSSLSPGWR